MKQKYLILLALTGLIVALDQWTKMLVHTRFQLGESIAIIENFFNLTYVRNYGAAFGFLADSHPGFREVFFLTLPPIALIIILSILRGIEDNDKVQATALALVFSGALGNFIDRVRFRYVIDFLDFHYYNKYSWPAFNVADSAIVCGVGILLFLMVLESTRKAPVSNAS